MPDPCAECPGSSLVNYLIKSGGDWGCGSVRVLLEWANLEEQLSGHSQTEHICLTGTASQITDVIWCCNYRFSTDTKVYSINMTLMKCQVKTQGKKICIAHRSLNQHSRLSPRDRFLSSQFLGWYKEKWVRQVLGFITVWRKCFPRASWSILI